MNPSRQHPSGYGGGGSDTPSSSSSSPSIRRNNNQSLLWSCIARDDVILAEAATTMVNDDTTSTTMVAEAAVQLLKKKNTPGWEYHTFRPSNYWTSSSSTKGGSSRKLKGVKFHIYDYIEDESEMIAASAEATEAPSMSLNSWEVAAQQPPLPPKKTVWIVACIYDPSFIDIRQVQSYIEKIVLISEPFRDYEYDWRYGSKLIAQDMFSPILLQRMEEVSSIDQLNVMNEQINEVKHIMSRNIELLLQREDKLLALQDESTQLQEMATVFQKKSKTIRRRMMWQNAKHGLVLGTAITAGVAIVVVPPLVAIL